LLDTVVHAHAYIMSLRRAKVELENRIEGKEGHTAAEGDIKEGLISNAKYVEVKLRETRSDEAEEDAAKSLRVLGFDEAAQKKSVNSLSGGLRMRVALCAAFFVGADVLLLDEPTNHLDFPSLLWLENRLRAYRGIFLMVCHDREILNNTCNAVCKITEVQSLKYYQMNYDAYEKQLAKDEKKKSQDTEKFLDRNRNVDFSSPAAREVAIKRAWLDAYNRKMVLRAGQFTLPPPTPLIPDNHQLGQEVPEKEISVIKVDNVRFSYDPVTLPFIFNTPISIDITMGSRMGVMGPNGAGKSTFLKLITDRLQPVEGTITTNKNATIAYFAQHHSAEMDLNETALDFMISRFEEEKVANLKAHLAKVGIGGDMTNTRMTDISQGMRSCVLFAAITYVCPSLLIMDEPTNFLDIETVDALISATNKYDGALLLVSHSRQFLNRCATSYLSIVPGKFNVFRTLSECEQSTYTFIAEMEAGGKVKIGSGALAQHGANASYGGDSEKKVASAGGLTI
jgi:ATP-binding cassette subfamily F protein 3